MIINGNAVHLPLAGNSVQCVVTSPPYWGLRDYGTDGQIGLEPTPEEYVANMVAVFREVRRVLRDDGTLWLNIGDSYAGANWRGGGVNTASPKQLSNYGTTPMMGRTMSTVPLGLKQKDLVGIPWRVAFALQADGWWLRSDIIWHKPNPMPESVKDRCTRSHEYVFMLTKSARYYYGAEAVKEPSVEPIRAREKHNGESAVDTKMRGHDANCGNSGTRNKRDVWTISTKPFKGAHFAVMPPDLVEPCILAGSRPGDVVLDPFAGAGTVGLVASRLGRRHIGVELSLEYCQMAEQRIYDDAPLLAGVAL